MRNWDSNVAFEIGQCQAAQLKHIYFIKFSKISAKFFRGGQSAFFGSQEGSNFSGQGGTKSMLDYSYFFVSWWQKSMQEYTTLISLYISWWQKGMQESTTATSW